LGEEKRKSTKNEKISTFKEAFASIDEKLVKASMVLGASQVHTFRKILLPLAGKGICAGMVMTWARALGEFGATSMIEGQPSC
jgi:molybdate transport system permease protein